MRDMLLIGGGLKVVYVRNAGRRIDYPEKATGSMSSALFGSIHIPAQAGMWWCSDIPSSCLRRSSTSAAMAF